VEKRKNHHSKHPKTRIKVRNIDTMSETLIPRSNNLLMNVTPNDIIPLDWSPCCNNIAPQCHQ